MSLIAVSSVAAAFYDVVAKCAIASFYKWLLPYCFCCAIALLFQLLLVARVAAAAFAAAAARCDCMQHAFCSPRVLIFELRPSHLSLLGRIHGFCCYTHFN